MSFILDALKKSENDRQRQSAPALFEVKVAAPRRNFPLWAVGLGVLFGVNILVLLWFLLRQPAPANPAVSEVAAAPAISNPTPAGMVTVPATSTYIPAGGTPNVTVGAGNASTDAGVVGVSPAPPLAEEPVLSGQEPSVPPDYDARDYRPAITPAQASAVAAARREMAPSRDEVVAQGTQVPDLRLDLHVYDPDPAKRFVFINMRKLREGDSLPEGVRLDSITQTGAKLTYRGTQFTLDANQSGFVRQPRDLDRREAVDDPLLHLPRIERLVEAQRRLVPVEHGPLHATTAALLRDAREGSQQRTTDAMTALRGAHEEIFEIQARPADECRKIEEIQRKTRRFSFPFRDQHVDHRVRRLELAQKIFRRRFRLIEQLFVLRELAHEARDDRRVCPRCGPDVQHGLHYSAMYQCMSLSRSSTKRS